MRTCPNCGHENAETDNYCANCGTPLTTNDLRAVQDESSTPSTTSPTGTGSGTQETIESRAPRDEEPTDSPVTGGTTPPPSWTSSPAASAGQSASDRSSIPPPVEFRPGDAGPSVEEEWRMSSLGPPPPRRRTWLWILVGLIGLCLLVCVGLVVYIQTDSGSEWWSDIQTEAAEQATERAD